MYKSNEKKRCFFNLKKICQMSFHQMYKFGKLRKFFIGNTLINLGILHKGLKHEKYVRALFLESRFLESWVLEWPTARLTLLLDQFSSRLTPFLELAYWSSIFFSSNFIEEGAPKLPKTEHNTYFTVSEVRRLWRQSLISV